ncbi:DNA replication complex GINS protein SLD5 isoform X1 [Primulina tabacum]|uniref:DNA replication complex GINS protein SLD5 isoform X1 n=1 Tax=Primulina tabacum TaxID=48773 RepID=UPI003F5A485F
MEASVRERSLADDYESLLSTTDAELLKRAWKNEKASPEILKFEAALIHRSRQQIQLMEETVEDFNKSGVDSLTVSLYQMDLDRTMFLLRSYLRTRLQKIEKYVFHIQKTTELWNQLSRQEQKFARSCAEDLKHHLKESVLSKLPNQYQSHLKQSSASEEDDMAALSRKEEYVELQNISMPLWLEFDKSKEAADNDLILNAIKKKISMDGVATRQYTLNNGLCFPRGHLG